VCDGSGWIEVDDLTAKPCACRAIKLKKATSRRIGTGIPKRFRGVGFDRKPIVDMDSTLTRQIRGYVRDIDTNLDKGRGLWLFGDVGTGKTSLAMLVSKAALEAGRSVAIYSMPRLLADIKETYEDRSEHSYMQLFDRLVGVDLLHIDDLGAEKRTEWVLEQVYSIINERWQEQRSIVVTTNLIDVDELRDQIGPRTVSRLHEMCELIPIMGRDRRMQQDAA
ncbi:MAG: replication protein DnaC, partial [Thermoleophilaceae bacterium]|nr:replication protein DnaC [Thermoleophilaceae bacterium]